jgi:methionyl aminopeptidase
MKIKNNHFAQSQIINLKDDLWLKRQKHAGRCVANCLIECGKAIKAVTPNLSLIDLENIAIRQINSMDCIPTFYNYKGFPGKVCISVNNQLVHGIPTDYVLQDGDVVSVDLGATFEGAIADAARTWIYGTPRSQEHVRLIQTCKDSLAAGIKAIEIGKHLGVIGYAIHQYTKNSGFNLITNYGGHGLDYNKPHSEPFVNNKSQSNEGIRIQSGLSIAIEPMLVIGEAKTKILDDKWTVVTPGIGVHFENSVTIMESGVHVVTETPYDN